MGRRIFIAGNWKMNKGPAEADTLAAALKKRLSGQASVDVAVAPPAVSLAAVVARLKHTGIHVAAQNLHTEASGAFTGELSGEMLRQVGCEYVIIGHSERRQYFAEDDALVNAKIRAAFRAGLLPIVCVGETLAQRDAGAAEEIVATQVIGALEGLGPDQVTAITLAYEPVWAIGTGRTATPETAQEMHATIRAVLARLYPAWVATQTRIQYGGSVNAKNAAALLGQPDIDGALVGGASLDAEGFATIVEAGASKGG